MPYRAELKRPDLKGSFPCSVCGKIFCHSSSLSRHRMQAHFKSYTCTKCSQEISSNETLRSHMFRMHSISRMFMCRCCNWAFPDKTSLHIHMQSMLRNGTPGDVAVLARSSTEDGPCEDLSPGGSPTYSAENLLKHQIMQATNNNSAHASNNNMSSIFPSLLKAEGTAKPVLPLDLSSLAPNQWLSAWLANNPLGANLAMGNLQSPIKFNEQAVALFQGGVKEELDDEYDELEVHTTEEDIKDEDRVSEVSPTSVIVKLETAKVCHKRSLPVEEAVDIDIEGDECQPAHKMSLDEKDQMSPEQPSPTVSDTHTSGSSSHPGDSSPKCFDCQVAKGKLSASEVKIREYERKIRDLEVKLEDYKKSGNESARPAPLLPFPSHLLPNPATSLALFQNPAIKVLLNNLMQAQLNRC